MNKPLGDKVEEFFEETGVKAAVDRAAKLMNIKDCGCAGRKNLLNQAGRLIGIGENGEVVDMARAAYEEKKAARRAVIESLKKSWESDYGSRYDDG
jgi:hypothetical protein